MIGNRDRLLVLAAFLMIAPALRADMTIRDFDPSRHDRFYAGSTPPAAFLGGGLDFSSVGKSVGGSTGNRWATLISGQYAIGSRHNAIENGSTVQFAIGDGAAATFVTATVAASSIVLNPAGLPTANSDLIVYRLSAPVDSRVAVAAVVADTPQVVGQSMFVYGQGNRVGRNVINGLAQVDDDGIGSSGFATLFDFRNPANNTFANAQVGGDLARLETGDSGGPSFLNIGGQLALVGIHWFNYEAGNIPGSPFSGSGDTYVSRYIPRLNEAITRLGGSGADFVRVVAVPEPASLAIAGCGTVAVLALARRRRPDPV